MSSSPKCPDCGCPTVTHCPTDDAEYICQECGNWFNSTRTIAYADPPYIGCAHRYPEKQEVDHRALIAQLEGYDAWALSCHSPSLHILLPMCPNYVRIASWVKPFAIFKPNVNPAYAWEPVLYKPLPRARDIPTVRDWLSANVTLRKGVVGAKPPAFCYWLFELLGAREGDEFIDLYPGTGIVGQCWASWQTTQRCCQEVMNLTEEAK